MYKKKYLVVSYVILFALFTCMMYVIQDCIPVVELDSSNLNADQEDRAKIFTNSLKLNLRNEGKENEDVYYIRGEVVEGVLSLGLFPEWIDPETKKIRFTNREKEKLIEMSTVPAPGWMLGGQEIQVQQLRYIKDWGTPLLMGVLILNFILPFYFRFLGVVLVAPPVLIITWVMSSGLEYNGLFVTSISYVTLLSLATIFVAFQTRLAKRIKTEKKQILGLYVIGEQKKIPDRANNKRNGAHIPQLV